MVLENIVPQEQYMLTTRKSLIHWYRDQLAKFYKLGIGKFTEHNTKVSQTLIDATKNRIVQLGGVEALDDDWGRKMIQLPSENNSTTRVRAFREKQLVKQKLREMMNDNHTNGTASHIGSKSNGNNGHEGGQS
tara:strand:- start:708 stop:1106 length:399 start_codon:yes stop_codon:yes gene_type:complete